MDEFPNNLKTARKRAGLSQEDICKKLDIAKGTYSCWETGKRKPDIITVKKLCSILNVASDDLLGIHYLARLEIPSPREQEIIHKFRYLEDDAKERIESSLQTEYEQARKKAELASAE